MSSSDDSSDDEKAPVERVDTGSSGLYKMKKFIATKTVGTKAGRKVIIGMMGEEGDKLLDALKQAASKYASQKDAKRLKKDFLKIVLKGKLMFDEKRLTLNNTSHAAQPINDLALGMVDYCEKQADENLDVEPLSDKFHVVRDLIADLMRPHMQVKNTDTLLHIFNFYGDPQFLRALLIEDRFAAERDAIKVNLTPIAQDIRKRADMFRDKPQKCYLNKCPKLRAPATGAFIGSIYCPHHHLNTVVARLDKPVVDDFLNQTSKASQYFVQYLRSNNEESKEGDSVDFSVLFRFNDAVKQYRRLRNNLRKPRAELIFSKFVTNERVAASVGLSPATVKQVSDDLNSVRMQMNPSRTRGILHHLYDKAFEESTTELQTIFDKFLKSTFFDEYAQAVTLPAELMDEARRRHTMIPGQAAEQTQLIV